MTERQLQEAVVELARLLRWRLYHTFDSRRSSAGFPDLVMVRRGRLLFAELKSSVGIKSQSQEAWLYDLEVAASMKEGRGWACPEVYVWRPESWSSGEIERVLR